jgi:hypothetical protein
MANDNTFSINPKNGKKDKRFVYVAEYKKCKQCGIEIIRKRREGRRDWDNRKYCSIDCSIKARVGKKPFEMTDAVREKISKNTKLAMQKDGVINKIKEYLKYNHPTRGKHLSEETKNKISISNIGKKISIESRKKMSIAQSGDKSHCWRGGISNNPYPQEWNDILKDSIRCRDSFMCQECGIHQDELSGIFKKLSIHHIDYDKENCNPDNLITLCNSCHIKTNFNREYWIKYFKNI